MNHKFLLKLSKISFLLMIFSIFVAVQAQGADRTVLGELFGRNG